MMRVLVPLVLLAACGDKEQQDADGDGVAAGRDCDDTDASVSPRASEVCDGVDNNCDGQVDEGLTTTWYADEDGDGAGDPSAPIESCAPPGGHVPSATDCDDTTADVGPSITETCDGLDNDCDGETDEGVVDAPTWYIDADGDGVGVADPATNATQCDAPAGFSELSGDCDDDDDSVYPGAPELCDGLDNDCDELDDNVDASAVGAVTVYPDLDGDGFGDDDGAAPACEVGPLESDEGGDCDDDNDTVNPGAPEICGNLVDEDCDGARTPCVLPLDDAEAVLEGTRADGRLGFSVASRADIDGDGTDDALVGAPGGSSAGAVSVLYGPVTAGTRAMSVAASATLSGITTGDRFGQAVALLGDLDGDGGAELAVGAPSVDTVGADKGAVYLFESTGLGSASALNADAVFYGEGNADEAGAWLSPAGDVDDDGLTDLLVGAAGSDSEAENGGAVYLLLSSELASGTYTLSTAGAKRTGSAGGESVGASGGGVGDVNADGIDDLVVGGSMADDGTDNDVGKAWVLFGPVTGSASLSDSDAVLLGDQAVGFLGFASSGGDLTGDGTSDLVVSAPGADDSATGVGAVYVLPGGTSLAWDGQQAATLAQATVVGERAEGRLGQRVDARGDLDGDGTSDLLASAITGPAANGGVVYAWLGPLSGALSTADAEASLRGVDSGDNAGGAFVAAGSLGGSSRDGVLVGATGVDAGASEGGAVYLIGNLRL